jgi:hypothetical protein
MQNSRLTETFVAQTVIGGKNDGLPLNGNITVTNRGEQIANFSTNLLDKSGSLTYNREASNLTVYQLKKGS